MALTQLLGGTRGRAITAAASALAAFGLALAVLDRGCDSPDGSPLEAVHAFVAAARAGDRRAMYDLSGPRTRSQLDAAAARATQLVQNRRYSGVDLIRATLSETEATTYEIDTPGDERALVRATADSGRQTVLELVKIAGRWRLELIAPQ